MTDYKHILEHFGCECSSLEDTLRFSCFLPLKGDDEDDVIYLSSHIDQWRRGVVYKLWDGFKSLFSKEDRSYGWSLINKKFWEEYYTDSVWNRVSIALKYFCGTDNFEHSIYNTTIVRNEDLPRLDNLLLNFAEKEGVCDNFTTELESRDHRLFFSIEKIAENCPVWLLTQYQFKSHTGIKRFWIALKYAFGSDSSCYGNTDEFEINKKSAAEIRYIIKEVIRRNKEPEDETKDKTIRSNTS